MDMSNRLALGAYWKPRRESIEQCADRFWKFMQGLRECNNMFTRWYRLGRSRKDALGRKVDAQSRQELLRLLDEGRHRRNVGREIMEGLGSSVGIWNGAEPGKEVSLAISCGQYDEVPGLLGNSVVLDLPEDLGELVDSAKTGHVVIATVMAWDPDWVGVFSREAQRSRDWWKWPFIDWIVYVSCRIKEIRDVPSPSSVTQVGDVGSLIVVQPNPPSATNAEDLERIRRIDEIVQPHRW